MRFLKKRRDSANDDPDENDPLSGVANFLDIALVFIASVIIPLFTAYHLQELFSETSEITITKKSKNGELEVITKKGKRIKVIKLTKERAEGRGERLGVAYKLEDGSMVYVPD